MLNLATGRRHNACDNHVILNCPPAKRITMPTISKQPLIDFVQAIFQRAGAPEDSAKCVSEHLVAGDSSGHASHGLMRLQQYIEEV